MTKNQAISATGAAGQVTITVQNAGSDRAPVDNFLAAIQKGVDPKKTPTVAPRVAVGWHHLVSRTITARRMPWLEATQAVNGSGP